MIAEWKREESEMKAGVARRMRANVSLTEMGKTVV